MLHTAAAPLSFLTRKVIAFFKALNDSGTRDSIGGFNVTLEQTRSLRNEPYIFTHGMWSLLNPILL